MKLSKNIEEKLLLFVKEIFVNDEWDFRHTLSCVKIMKALLSNEGGNERVLLTSIYLHDIGYADLIKNNYSLEERIEAKKKHMELGAKQAEPLLVKLGYSKSEIKQILHLIRVHDKLDKVGSKEELLLVEADSLGAIDPSVGSNFGDEEYAKYVAIFERKRLPLIKTKTGKKILLEFAHSNKLFNKYFGFLKK